MSVTFNDHEMTLKMTQNNNAKNWHANPTALHLPLHYDMTHITYIHSFWYTGCSSQWATMVQLDIPRFNAALRHECT